MSQKEELPKPVNLSLSDLNLDTHVKTFEFLKRAWINEAAELEISARKFVLSVQRNA